MKELIVGDKIGISYEGRRVFENLNFSLSKGEVLCIVGENGSGKTSLINAILGIKKYEGSLEFESKEVKKYIGYLAQKNNIQNDFPAKIKEVVLSGRVNHLEKSLFYSKKDKEVALENMKKLDIDNIREKSFNEISGGQKQRVLLARALCATGKLLILDEPEASLDPLVTKNLFSIIEEIKKEKNIGILIVSHNIKSSIKVSDKVLHIDGYGKGKHFFGSKEDYLKNKIFSQFTGGCYDSDSI